MPTAAGQKNIDCVVCGSCVVDVLVHPMPVSQGLTPGKLYEVGPLELEVGGIVSNSGAAMARMGLRVAAFSYVGADHFGAYLKQRYRELGIDPAGLVVHPSEPTSTSAVLVDPSGERTFAHCVGAPRTMDGDWFEKNIDLFSRSRAALIGYFSLMPQLEADLPRVLTMLRDVGCTPILEAAGDGGSLDALAPALPYLDVYIPSYEEARQQTGIEDCEGILNAFRTNGATGVLGIKLGSKGAVICPSASEVIAIPPAPLPGALVDTTGAGDAFLAGYIVGMLKGFSPQDAGRLASAAGASCVCGLGAVNGLKTLRELLAMAGLPNPSKPT